MERERWMREGVGKRGRERGGRGGKVSRGVQSCPRVGWTRGSGRVGSGHDFAGFGRVGSGRVSTSDFLVFY